MNTRTYKTIIVLLIAVLALIMVNNAQGKDDTSAYLLTLEKRISMLESCLKSVCSIDHAKITDFTLPDTKDNIVLSNPVNTVITVQSTPIPPVETVIVNPTIDPIKIITTPNPQDKPSCNQGRGNGSENCDPGNSNNHNPSNDENLNNRGGNNTPKNK